MDIHDFVQKASIKTVEKIIPIKHQQFADFGLDERIEKLLTAKGYSTPTPIQDQTILHTLEGRDIIGLAQTGTGKTAAFLLPLIHQMMSNPKLTVLILAPTRELAVQIDKEFRSFSFGLKLMSAVCVGGMPIGKQIRDLNMHPHFVIGTPGRVQDLVDRGVLPLHVFNAIVLDEVDHMLDMGFIEPITEIMSALPENRQTLFFSATMPERIRSLTRKFLNDPITIEVSSGNTTHSVDQHIMPVKNEDQKLEQLDAMLRTADLSKVLIFSETKRDVERLTNVLNSRGHRVASLHGDKAQSERRRALQQFTDNTVSVLVATDIAARGLDVKNISHVINYTIPQTFDDYVHRIGRTGRGGAKGTAITFVH
jgi:superfamily II DNA/RNA helicase